MAENVMEQGPIARPRDFHQALAHIRRYGPTETKMHLVESDLKRLLPTFDEHRPDSKIKLFVKCEDEGIHGSYDYRVVLFLVSNLQEDDLERGIVVCGDRLYADAVKEAALDIALFTNVRNPNIPNTVPQREHRREAIGLAYKNNATLIPRSESLSTILAHGALMAEFATQVFEQHAEAELDIVIVAYDYGDMLTAAGLYYRQAHTRVFGAIEVNKVDGAETSIIRRRSVVERRLFIHPLVSAVDKLTADHVRRCYVEADAPNAMWRPAHSAKPPPDLSFDMYRLLRQSVEGTIPPLPRPPDDGSWDEKLSLDHVEGIIPVTTEEVETELLEGNAEEPRERKAATCLAALKSRLFSAEVISKLEHSKEWKIGVLLPSVYLK